MTDPVPGTSRPSAVGNVRTGNSSLPIQASTIGPLQVHPPRRISPVPCQVPPVAASWTDRDQELARLTTWIAAQPGYPVPVVAVHGPVGVGKTSFAQRLVHALADRYPGGQFHADLGSTGGPARVTDVLGRLLRAVQPGPLPAGGEELTGWWRSATATRPPVCLLLDGVTHADQVRALLPGGSGHFVVVTSRLPLPDLAAQGAFDMPLGPLDHAAARAYLSRCLGAERVLQEPDPVNRLIDLTAGLPGALALSVTQLTRHPSRSVSAVVNALDASRYRTAASLPGAIVSAALETEYSGLPRSAARLYRKSALLPVDTLDAHLVAAVTGQTPTQAGADLADLAASGLLHQDADHPIHEAVYRYSSPSLRHAREHAAQEETDGAGTEARRRAADWYLASATAAERLLTPSHRHLERIYVYTPEHPMEFGDRQAALSWLDAQCANLMVTIRSAHAAGWYGAVWQLVHAMWPWWRAAQVYDLWIEAHRLGLEAAQLYNSALAKQEMCTALGIGLRGVRRYDEAIECFTDVLDGARSRSDAGGEAQAFHELGSTTYAAGRLEEAVEHLEQARTLREHGEDRRGVALTDILLGQVHLSRGDAAAAVDVLVAARTTLVEVDAPHEAAQALAWLGRAYSAAGRHDEARQAGSTAQHEFERTGSRQWTARSLEFTAESVAAAGEQDEARKLFALALAAYEPLSAADAARVRARLS